SLPALIERVGPLPMAMSVRLVADVANALTHAHGARDEAGQPLGIVHRDVTPDNLMVGFDGTVKLLDFGIAKSSAQLRKTQQGQLKGKLAYMSPEQYRGERLDGRSDLFSLGLCLYEALTGTALYDRGSEAETVAAILFDEAPPSVRAVRPEVPEMLDRIVQTMLAKDRQKRATTAEAVSAALEKWLVLERQGVREADIAGFVQAMFPGRSDSLPELDRTPLKPPPRRDSLGPLRRQALGADLDDLTEDLERRQAAKRRQVMLMVALVLIAGAAALVWALSKPPAPAAAPPAAASRG
ncbi:MAG: serine/threonine-protein kinase, partial [Myxococcota bacterium]